ncbi:hypothetical protein [Rodentibacter trehalosifermentans]|uniref:hypothetical protein n=1 Tax=Rodentibacter trehalosifermentans TaxID=1908263 RepID=UPI001054DB97|nr:hypothetical protein [Rodentibacter trehalosifermentans]
MTKPLSRRIQYHQAELPTNVGRSEIGGIHLGTLWGLRSFSRQGYATPTLSPLTADRSTPSFNQDECPLVRSTQNSEQSERSIFAIL